MKRVLGYICGPRAVVAICLTGLGLVLPATSAHAWGEGGHEVVAYIAQQRLNPKAKAVVKRLLETPIPPSEITKRDTDFVHAAIWADEVRGESGFEKTRPWHFVDNPFGMEPTTPLPSDLPGTDTIVTALKSEIATLKNPKVKQEEKARALRFLIHFVGDIHQPLHCATRVSPLSPGGDRGGNEYRIRIPGKEKTDNLHSFWDDGLGAFPDRGTDISAAAGRAMQENPASNPAWKAGGVENVSGWMQESEGLARHVAYEGLHRGKLPSDAYIKKGKNIANKRVAWAGYRLAALLNQLCGK